LPDAAFTELELKAGVQHIMRSGYGGQERRPRWNSHRRLDSEDDLEPLRDAQQADPSSLYFARRRERPDYRSWSVQFRTYRSALDWSTHHPDIPFTRDPRGQGFIAQVPGKEERGPLEDRRELEKLSAHLAFIMKNSGSNRWRLKVQPFHEHAFCLELNCLGRQDLYRLWDLLGERIRWSRQYLAEIEAESRRFPSMRSKDYGEPLFEALVKIEEQAIRLIRTRLECD
jgi:hypothetical protein